jgi:hypothetical protein
VEDVGRRWTGRVGYWGRVDIGEARALGLFVIRRRRPTGIAGIWLGVAGGDDLGVVLADGRVGDLGGRGGAAGDALRWGVGGGGEGGLSEGGG